MKKFNKKILLSISLVCLAFPFAATFVWSSLKNYQPNRPDDWILTYKSELTAIMSKVEAAGGWDVLMSDCIEFSKKHKGGMFNVDYYWQGGRVTEFTGELPVSLNALHPVAVHCLTAEHTSPVVLIHFQGRLSLEVRCGDSTIPSSKYFRFLEHQITNNVYLIAKP
jgi:hypothetical protein